MVPRSLPTRRQALLACITALVAALISAAIVSAAALEPAPAGVLPMIVAVCIGCPMLAALELPGAVAVLSRHEGRALAQLRRSLDRLPETEHPLGL